jgi:putative flippase GtrA
MAVAIARSFPWRASAYSFVGIINTSIDIGVFWILTAWLGVHPLAANVAGFSLGAINSYVMNARITFRDRGVLLLASKQILLFAAITLFNLAISSLALDIALMVFASFPAKLVSVAVTLAAGYLLTSRFVFPSVQRLKSPRHDQGARPARATRTGGEDAA